MNSRGFSYMENNKKAVEINSLKFDKFYFWKFCEQILKY